MFGPNFIEVIFLVKLSACAQSDSLNINAPGGTRCYSCPSVREPYLCNVTTQCGPDEQCYTDEYSTNDGTNIFSVGCRKASECYTAIVRRSVSSKHDVRRLKCVECCHGNQCNRGGCSAGLGKSNVCYNCRFIQNPRLCQHETTCQGNEHCFIQKVLTQSFDIEYIQGCVENAECETLRQPGPIVGKRDTVISTLCASCCYGDKCNDVCSPQGFTSATQRTTSTISTTSTHNIYRTTSTPVTEDTTALQTTNSELNTTSSVTKDTNVIDTTYGMANTNSLMTEDTTAVDTTKAVHSGSLPTSTGTASVSTMGNTVTESTSTSTTTSPSTSYTSPSKSTTASPSTGYTPSPSTSTTTSALPHTVCHKECAGSEECRATDVQLCRSPTPYCLTVLHKHASGSYNISKGCADRNTCNDKWLKQTSGDNRCVFFNPAIKETFTCFFCCTAHKCNMQSFPPYMSSLYRGTENL